MADPASPVPAQQPQEPKQAEPAPPVQSEVKAETAPAEPENKEVPSPEPTPVPEPQSVKSSASTVAPAALAAAALVAAPAAASAAAPVAAAAVPPAAVLAAALVVGPATATALAKAQDDEPKVESAAGDNVPKEDTKDTDWQQRELELLKKIDELEKVKTERSEDGLKLELKVREEEIDLLKARVKNLETELQAALSKPSAGKNHEMIENIKQQHEELLSKARGMIFDKTKMVKNQELQIEALTTQVQSLKDINLITKDLLEIRNSEVKAMEDRLQAMEARFKVEKERYGLVLERAQTSTTINDDLRKEYETQLAIFKELRGKYEQRVEALAAENAKLKELNLQLKGGPSG